MSVHSVAPRRGARLSLLIAALLYIFGATAGPAVHVHGAIDSPVTAFGSGETGSDIPDPDSGIPAPHDELGCFVCQALGTLGAPSAGSPVGFLTVEVFAPASEPDLVFLSPRSTTSQARAPPAA